MVTLQEPGGRFYEVRISHMDAESLCRWQESLLVAARVMAGDGEYGSHIEDICLLLSELAWDPSHIGAEACKPRRGVAH